MTRRLHMRLDADALKANVEVVRRHAPRSRVIAVIKADAYGHGVEFAVRHLAGRVEGFAVASVAEAVNVRRLGVHDPVWVLSDFSPRGDMRLIAEYRLCPVIHSREQFEAVCGLSEPLREVVIKIDSGMGRLGFEPHELVELVTAFRRRSIGEIRVMTHLANADDVHDATTHEQVARFNSATEGLALERSLANSAGVLAWHDTHADWVRPGIMLYGGSPLKGASGPELGLKPVMTLSARILSVRTLRQGQAVGYGGTWRCPVDSRVALLACGYGDGYPRHAPNGTPVGIAGRHAPLVGRVSMDTMVADITGIDANPEDEHAVLWGEGLSADVVANHCGTISYELFCGVAPRRCFAEECGGRA